MVRGSGWAARRLFAANSMAIGKKNNAADRPGPRYHRPQGVMQRALKCQPNQFGRCIFTGQVPARLDDLAQSGFQSSSESVTGLQQRQNVRE